MGFIHRNIFIQKWHLITIGVMLLFQSCSKENFEAEVPAYITINSFEVTSDYSLYGSASSNVTDAWVYLNDDLIGAFELPARFPVLKKGTYNVKVFAGVKANGVSGIRERYLFYTAHEEQITFTEGKEITIAPKVTYNSSTQFAWKEDFESAAMSFIYTTGSDTIINKTTTDVFEGNASGRVYLASYMDFFEAKSPAFSNVSSNRSPVFLEMNFKTNEPILVGLKTDDDEIAIVELQPTSSWKKIYIDLTDAISQKPANTNFYLFFGMLETSTEPFQSANPEFYIDNLKVLHY